MTPLLLSLSFNYCPGVPETLLAAGAEVNVRSSDGNTPLTYALWRGNNSSATSLVRQGAQVNEKGKDGVTPLMLAARQKSLEMVRLLLERGADPTIADNLKETPLLHAAYNGSPEIMTLLLEKGADPKAATNTGVTILMSAAAGGEATCVRMLLERDVPVDARDNSGRTALMAACGPQAAEIVKALVEKGADVHAADTTGCTPLMRMALLGNREAVRFLLERGAKADAKDNRGRTALDRAVVLGHTGTVEALQTQGGGSTAEAGEVRRAYLRDAVQASLQVLQKSARTFQTRIGGTCISCHHQGLPALAVGVARERGFMVDMEKAGKQSEFILKVMGERQKRAFQQTDGEDPTIQCGYAFLALASDGYARNPLTGQIALYVAKKQEKSGCWTSDGGFRPPSEGSAFAATALLLRGLSAFAPQEHNTQIKAQIARAVAWLRKTPGTNTEDRAFRVLGLTWAGLAKEDGAVQGAVKALRAEQNADGGWSQERGLKSDSYATGQALVALQLAGDVTENSPVLRRGIDFLLKTQAEDGSWFVRSRSVPFQPYFETDFPYGKDQFISICGTGWATAALALTMPLRP